MDTKRLDLTKFVQFLTMKVSLKSLFDPGVEALRTKEAEEYISFIAKEINRLWLASKADPVMEKWEDQSHFHEALHYVTGSSDMRFAEDPHFSDAKENLLNWIIPTYDSMWRIVLTTVRQVYFQSDIRQSNAYSVVRFMREPCRRIFATKTTSANSRPTTSSKNV